MKTLYLSDLDGTLLTPDQNLSPYAARTLRRLIREGLPFSYATARSRVTASIVTQGICPKLPAVYHNGIFLTQPATGRVVRFWGFTPKEQKDLLDYLLSEGICPIVYALQDGRERFFWLEPMAGENLNAFLATRPHDPRRTPISQPEGYYRPSAYYFTCIEDQVLLLPLYRILRGRFYCIYGNDLYSGKPWLEILPKTASKATAALALKRWAGAEELVCFGDGINDLPLFEIADRCYAVENACKELKEKATGILPSNREDGVVRFLEEEWKTEKNRLGAAETV